MKRVTVFALALGLILGVLAHPAIAGTTYYGAATDPSDDGDHGFGIEAELVFASVLADGTNLQVTARFATFDAGDMATFVLDTDQNPATGYPGVDASHSDADRIGAEYNLCLWPDQPTDDEARLWLMDSGGHVEVASYSASYLPDGIQVSVPLSDLGGEDGLLSFKVIGSQAGDFPVSDWGCLDYLTDRGQAEVRTTAVAIPAPSAVLLVAIGCLTGLAKRTSKRVRRAGA